MAYPSTSWQHFGPQLGLQPIGQASLTRQHPLGTLARAQDATYGEGGFLYLKGAASTAAGDVVVYNSATGATTRAQQGVTSAGLIAVAMSACTAGLYGWYQVAGAGPLKAGSVVAGASASLSATAGQLDDDASNTGIEGLVFDAATSGGFATAQMASPSLGVGGPGDGTLLAFAAGVVGNQTSPDFKLVVQNAGINEPELALFYRDAAHPTWLKVDGVESTGTRASVRNGTLGSHFEGFRRDGAVNPIFRLNSSPAMTLEFAAAGGKIAAGGLSRTTNVVTATTDVAHGFGVGETVTIAPGEAGFAGGAFAIASTPGANTFTYAQAGTNGLSTAVQDASTPVDVGLKRGGHFEWHFIVGGAAKAILYADAFVFQAGIRNIMQGSFETAFAALSADTTLNNNHHTVSVDATGGAKTIALATAAGCPGRQHVVKKVDASGNTVTIDAAGAETIDGAATKVLSTQWETARLVSNGTHWLLF